MTEETKANFELATRKKMRFPSAVGGITVEDLWDLPLTSARGASLDGTARMIHGDLKETQEVSFVDVRPDPRRGELEVQLEVVKRVIEVKVAERDAAKQAKDRAERRQRMLAVLADKQDEELRGKSREELEREIAELS